MTSILSQLKGVFNEPIQMQLSPNQKTFSQFFFFFFFFYFFWIYVEFRVGFEKKMSLGGYLFLNLKATKTGVT